MTIKGHKVVFGCTRSERCGGMYEGYWTETEQHWSIPALKLHGWVSVNNGEPRGLIYIRTDIQDEVNHDLEQREKRRHGIAC